MREAVKHLRAWMPPDLSFLPQGFYALGLAYLALLAYLFLYYLPAQLQDLKAVGASSGGISATPSCASAI